jgi:hypothetical protein
LFNTGRHFYFSPIKLSNMKKLLFHRLRMFLDGGEKKPGATVFVLFIFCFSLCSLSNAQDWPTKGNVFVITIDGFRWEELFKGADSSLMFDTKNVKDTILARQMYWDSTTQLRRQRLMPFFWNVIAKQGQLYGNRLFNNKVDVKNFYKISYPGYNELLTGYADWKPMLNFAIQNKNTNVLEYLNSQPDYDGKTAAFSSWNIMPYVFNEKRSGFFMNSGYEMLDGDDETEKMIDTVQKNAREGKTRNDQLTYLSARQYIERNHPKVFFLGLGESDEYGHQGAYDMYLQKAMEVDRIIADLWYYIQTEPFYRNNTSLLITTDHGRGKGAKWVTHGFWAKGSGETWLALMGPDISPEGEIKENGQIWQKQIAATIAALIGEAFIAKHPVAEPIAVSLYSKSAKTLVAAKNTSSQK